MKNKIDIDELMEKLSFFGIIIVGILGFYFTGLLLEFVLDVIADWLVSLRYYY